MGLHRLMSLTTIPVYSNIERTIRPQAGLDTLKTRRPQVREHPKAANPPNCVHSLEGCGYFTQILTIL
jgi:hypothetical protein